MSPRPDHHRKNLSKAMRRYWRRARAAPRIELERIAVDVYAGRERRR